MQTIVVIEDNQAIREAVSAYLKLEDFDVVEFDSCGGVTEFLRKKEIDLVVADITLPDGNGFMLVKEIRTFSEVPIIFLTSRSAESDRILGFELGGDDYIQKPFSHKELVLRIKAVLKRKSPVTAASETDGIQRWRYDDIIMEVDLLGHKIRLDNVEMRFTSTEWKIITHLISNAHVVLSREQILDHSLEYSFDGYDRIIDTHIKNIRAKLGDCPWIETIRGYGYSFNGTIA